MAHDHNDIYSIVERLRILEEGLDKNQRSVNQLGATFRPKTVAVLTAKTDPKNPLAGKLVGGSESVERDETAVAEDVLDKVKKSFADYLSNIADEIKTDTDLKDKKKDDTDIKEKDTKDRTLVANHTEDTEIDTALSGEISAEQPRISMKEMAAVKTVNNECGLWEVHGDESGGFEIHRTGRCLPTKFKTLDEAEMALEMFNARVRARQPDETADYLEER